MSGNISPRDFVQKWSRSELRERASSHEHFIDLCNLLKHGTPAELDPEGSWFTFEYGATKVSGGQGWADVWKRNFFGWEYKGKHKDLDEAYKQLLQYRESLLNPPLLVVSDMERILIHTNFTNSAKRVYSVKLDDLLTKGGRDLISQVFNDPESLKAPITLEQVTQEAAKEFGKLAEVLRGWGEDPQSTAHFLIRILFCLFAEDIGLLPKNLFTEIVQQSRGLTKDFTEPLRNLFTHMAKGGYFGPTKIAHFDGGLFDDDFVLEMPSDGLDILRGVCTLDWSSIEPAILGTLFERSLDPEKRAQSGAHYTSKEDILLVVEPVLMTSLQQEWGKVETQARQIMKDIQDLNDAENNEKFEEIVNILKNFHKKIGAVTILDPACGSGNFLYVALQQLLELQKEVINLNMELGADRLLPTVSPENLYGIELNTYAYELAQSTVWIGYIQWMFENGFDLPEEPILKPLENILNIDAILAYD